MAKTVNALDYLRENSDAFEFSQVYGLDGFLILENDFDNIIYANPKILQVLGYQNLQEIQAADLFLPEEFQMIHSATERFDFHLFRKDRSRLSAEGNILQLPSENSMLLAIRKTCNKKEQENLQKLKRYTSILKDTDLGAWQWNVQTGETIFDENWAKLLGYELQELEPTSEDTWRKLAHPEDLALCDQLFQDHFNGLTDYYLSEARMKHKNGNWVWVKDKGKVVSWTQDGKPEWMAGFQEEISEIKHRLGVKKMFIDQAPTAIAMFDNEMRYIAASRKWYEDYKLEEEDITGKSHYEIFPNMPEAWKVVHQQCLAGAIRKKDEDGFINDQGEEQWISWEVRPWYTHEDEIGGIIMNTVDITRIKEAEKEVFEKQRMMEAVFYSIEVGLVACDRNGQLTLFNEATKRWHGLPAEQIPQEKLSEYYGLYTADGKRPLEMSEIPLLKVLEGGKLENEEIMIKPNNGKPIIVSVNGKRLFDENGEIDGAVVAMHDITNRVETEDKLRISEEAFRGGFEHAAIGMALISPEGKWLKVNTRLCEIVGYREEELRKLTFQDITYPADLESDLQLLQELIAGERQYYHMDKRYFHKNGHLVYIHLAVSVVRDEKGDPLYFVSQITDITKEKVAEQKLRKALAEMEGLFESSTQVSIMSMNYDGVITSFNTGAENLLGYDKEEVIDKQTPLIFFPEKELQKISEEILTETGEKHEGMELFQYLAQTKMHDTREWTYIRKNGTTIPVQLSITRIEDEGETIGYLKVATNISKLKVVQRELSEILDLTKDQNDRLKNFAHIVSHNLRSHSSNFGMLLDLYIGDHPEEKENQILQMLYRASDNLKQTIDHLNEVTLIHTSVDENLKHFNLHSSIDKILTSVNAHIQESGIEVENLVPQNIEILSIKAYLDSILLNFTTNAIKYLDSEKDSFLRFSAEETPDEIQLKIEDNGLGIDLKRHGDKIFGMYKTFHRHKDSRGIGLFITKNQIEAMGGTITVKSQPGEGTEFLIKMKKNHED